MNVYNRKAEQVRPFVVWRDVSEHPLPASVFDDVRFVWIHGHNGWQRGDLQLFEGPADDGAVNLYPFASTSVVFLKRHGKLPPGLFI